MEFKLLDRGAEAHFMLDGQFLSLHARRMSQKIRQKN